MLLRDPHPSPQCSSTPRNLTLWFHIHTLTAGRRAGRQEECCGKNVPDMIAIFPEVKIWKFCLQLQTNNHRCLLLGYILDSVTVSLFFVTNPYSGTGKLLLLASLFRVGQHKDQVGLRLYLHQRRKKTFSNMNQPWPPRLVCWDWSLCLINIWEIWVCQQCQQCQEWCRRGGMA